MNRMCLQKQKIKIQLPLKALGSSEYHEETHGGETEREKTVIL